MAFRTLAFLLLIACPMTAYAQKPVYTNTCEIAHDLLDSTYRNHKIFGRDTAITIFDVNGVLTDCKITQIGNLKVHVINSGEEIERIRKGGIFRASEQRGSFVFTQEFLNGLTGYRIYYPLTNENCYWGFLKQQDQFYLKKKGCGVF